MGLAREAREENFDSHKARSSMGLSHVNQRGSRGARGCLNSVWAEVLIRLNSLWAEVLIRVQQLLAEVLIQVY